MATQGKESAKQAPAKRRRSLLGKKLGMTQLFEEGRWVPVTVLEVGPCTILQVKTLKRDGYEAVQLGFDATKKPRKRPQQAYLEKLGIAPMRFVKEVPFVDPQELRKPGEPSAKQGGGAPEKGEGETVGGETVGGETVGGETVGGGRQAAEKGEGAAQPRPKTEEASIASTEPVPGAVVGVSVFKGVSKVDVRGKTKGRGFAGVIRRHHFNAGPKSHGTKNIREPGSTGMHTDPARVIPGKKMPGHLGAALRKARNLDVIRVVEEDNLLVVRGSVPGANGSYVYIEESLE
jgi:large subunit ribosomal protein L3